MSPLALLSPAALNSKTMSSVAEMAMKPPSTFVSPSKKSSAGNGEDEITWDDPPSSPFDDNITTASRNTTKQSTDFTIFEDAREIQETPRPRFLAKSPSVTATFYTLTSVSENTRPKTPERMESPEKDMDTIVKPTARPEPYEEENIDDTCFSTFSEVPNTDMTAFARLGQRSPLKMHSTDMGRVAQIATPRRTKPGSHEETTTMLIDFTQQMEAFASAPSTATKNGNEPTLRNFLNSRRSPTKTAPITPGKKNIMTLLDFELPPAPTPRSIPTITVRELETLKSQYLSQISSLKATLSGREAEVESLKRAVNDAERRVGEAQETVRDERSAREHAEKEKSDWERRGNEFEQVLKSIKEEVIMSEKEREELLKRFEEAERRAVDAEAKAADAEARAAEAKSKNISLPNGDQVSAEPGTVPAGMFTAEQVQKQIDERLSQLGSELHVIYKEKHINKVANLKARNQKEMGRLKTEIDGLKAENSRLSAIEDKLLAAQDGTLSGPQILPSDIADREKDLKKLEQQRAEIEEQRAKVAGLSEEIKTMRSEQTELLKELEIERIEKGELVAAVDEMLALQNDTSLAVVQDFRKSVTGIPPPSRLMGPGFAGKSKMMRDLERMGSGRGAE